jgi:hypothetical protein
MNLVQRIPSHAAKTSIVGSIPIFVFESSEVKKMIADTVYPALSRKLQGIAMTAKIEAAKERGENHIQPISVSGISFIPISGSNPKKVPNAKPRKILRSAMIDPFIGEQMPSTIATKGLNSLMAFIFL